MIKPAHPLLTFQVCRFPPVVCTASLPLLLV